MITDVTGKLEVIDGPNAKIDAVEQKVVNDFQSKTFEDAYKDLSTGMKSLSGADQEALKSQLVTDGLIPHLTVGYLETQMQNQDRDILTPLDLESLPKSNPIDKALDHYAENNYDYFADVTTHPIGPGLEPNFITSQTVGALAGMEFKLPGPKINVTFE
jgi:hypothetical protein